MEIDFNFFKYVLVLENQIYGFFILFYFILIILLLFNNKIKVSENSNGVLKIVFQNKKSNARIEGDDGNDFDVYVTLYINGNGWVLF